MKLSQSATYAIFSMQYLARQREEAVTVKEIAAEFKFPEKHLAKIMQKLVKLQLLKSVRGIGGGYKLAKHPTCINLVQIITAIDGPIMPVG